MQIYLAMQCVNYGLNFFEFLQYVYMYVNIIILYMLYM